MIESIDVILLTADRDCNAYCKEKPKFTVGFLGPAVIIFLSSLLFFLSCSSTEQSSADSAYAIFNQYSSDAERDSLFRFAYDNKSTAPSYVVFIARDLNTGIEKEICCEAPFLSGAVHREFSLGYEIIEESTVDSIILNNHERGYEFRNEEALKNISFYDYPDFERLIEIANSMDLEHYHETFGDNGVRKLIYFENDTGFVQLTFAHVLFNCGIHTNRDCEAGNNIWIGGINMTLPSIDQKDELQGALGNEYHIDSNEFISKINNLPLEYSSIDKAVDLFISQTDGLNQITADSLFSILFRFIVKTEDLLTDLMYEDDEIDDYFSLIWADTSLHLKNAKEFESRLNGHNIRIGSSEGTIYLIYGFSHRKEVLESVLSNPTREFLELCLLDRDFPATEDAGIIIGLNEVVDRLIKWEQQSKFTTPFPMVDIKNSMLQYYLEMLIYGLDNTRLTYDTNKIEQHFIDAYEYMIEVYPDSHITTIVRQYYELMKAYDFIMNQEIREFKIYE